jgi:hypothetical protein
MRLALKPPSQSALLLFSLDDPFRDFKQGEIKPSIFPLLQGHMFLDE